MHRRCFATQQNAAVIVISLLALTTLLAAMTVVPVPAAAWVTSAGLLLFALSGLLSLGLGRRRSTADGGR